MKTNEEMIFDELMRHKLGDYSESPDMRRMNMIHAKKNRVMRLYRLSKLFSVICVAGLSLFGSYMLLKPLNMTTEQLHNNSDKIYLTHQYPSNNHSTPINFGYSSADLTSTISNSRVDNTAGNTPILTIQNPAAKNYTQPQFSKNSAAAKSNFKMHEINTNSKNTLPMLNNSLKTESKNPDPGKEKPKSKELGNTCKAAFDYYVSYDGKFNFTNFSDANSSATMLWDFGDGTTSVIYSPYHIYKNNGTYLVTLKISDSINSCSDSYQKTLVFGSGLKQQNHSISIKGRIIAESDPIEKVSVSLLLFSAEKNTYTGFAKTSSSLSGEYIFSDLKTGTYLVLADANNKQYVPTYWGNTPEINDAIEIRVMENDDQDLSGFNIMLARNKAINNYDAARIFANDSNNQTSVLVLDQNNNVLGRATVDHFGNINLNGFPPGDYNILNQQTGSISPIKVTPNNTFYGGDNIPVRNTTMTLVPNPAVNNVKFSINIIGDGQQAEIMIISENGNIVYHKNYNCTAGSYPFDIDISALSPGVYYVVVNVGGTQTMSGRLIKSNMGANN